MFNEKYFYSLLKKTACAIGEDPIEYYRRGGIENCIIFFIEKGFLNMKKEEIKEYDIYIWSYFDIFNRLTNKFANEVIWIGDEEEKEYILTSKYFASLNFKNRFLIAIDFHKMIWGWNLDLGFLFYTIKRKIKKVFDKK